MSGILQVVGGMMLIGIPVSMVLALAYTAERHPGELEVFCLFWFLVYVTLLLFAVVGFAGLVGVAMLIGAFR